MKVNFNSTDLKIIKHKYCKECIFNEASSIICGVLPCFVDSQVYVPTENLSDVFRL